MAPPIKPDEKWVPPKDLKIFRNVRTGDVAMRNHIGEERWVKPEYVKAALERGYTPMSEREVQVFHRKKYGSSVATAAANVADMLTMGISRVDPQTREYFDIGEEAQPTATTVGKVGGTILSLAPWGAVGAAGKAAAGVGKSIAKKGIAKKVGKYSEELAEFGIKSSDDTSNILRAIEMRKEALEAAKKETIEKSGKLVPKVDDLTRDLQKLQDKLAETKAVRATAAEKAAAAEKIGADAKDVGTLWQRRLSEESLTVMSARAQKKLLKGLSVKQEEAIKKQIIQDFGKDVAKDEYFIGNALVKHLEKQAASGNLGPQKQIMFGTYAEAAEAIQGFANQYGLKSADISKDWVAKVMRNTRDRMQKSNYVPKDPKKPFGVAFSREQGGEFAKKVKLLDDDAAKAASKASPASAEARKAVSNIDQDIRAIEASMRDAKAAREIAGQDLVRYQKLVSETGKTLKQADALHTNVSNAAKAGVYNVAPHVGSWAGHSVMGGIQATTTSDDPTLSKMMENVATIAAADAIFGIGGKALREIGKRTPYVKKFFRGKTEPGTYKELTARLDAAKSDLKQELSQYESKNLTRVLSAESAAKANPSQHIVDKARALRKEYKEGVEEITARHGAAMKEIEEGITLKVVADEYSDLKRIKKKLDRDPNWLPSDKIRRNADGASVWTPQTYKAHVVEELDRVKKAYLSVHRKAWAGKSKVLQAVSIGAGLTYAASGNILGGLGIIGTNSYLLNHAIQKGLLGRASLAVRSASFPSVGVGKLGKKVGKFLRFEKSTRRARGVQAGFQLLTDDDVEEIRDKTSMMTNEETYQTVMGGLMDGGLERDLAEQIATVHVGIRHTLAQQVAGTEPLDNLQKLKLSQMMFFAEDPRRIAEAFNNGYHVKEAWDVLKAIAPTTAMEISESLKRNALNGTVGAVSGLDMIIDETAAKQKISTIQGILSGQRQEEQQKASKARFTFGRTFNTASQQAAENIA